VDQLRGTPSAGTQPVTFTSTTVKTITGPKLPTLTAPFAPPTVTTSTLTVADDFVVQGVTGTVNITYPNDPDLYGLLLAPNRTSLLLFAGVGRDPFNRANFVTTVFDDAAFALTPIFSFPPPFTSRFYPQQPLADLGFGTIRSGGLMGSASGTWTFEIVDFGSD